LDKKARYTEGEKVTWIGALVNLVLAAVKFAAGIVGRSEALIADAVHSLSDLFSDIVVLLSLKVSKRPKDDALPYGYGRVETVGTGVLGVILVFTGIKIFWDAVNTINLGIDYLPNYYALGGALLSIIVKEWMYRYTIRAGERLNSPSVMANAWHHRSDALSSIASFFGIGAAMLGWPLFDPLAALIVTALIVRVGWKILKDSFVDLIDAAVKKEVSDKIVEAALNTEGVLDYHDLKTRKIGSEILVDIHIEVNPWMNVSEAHRIADEVRDAITAKVANIADVLVHIDPEGELSGIVYSIPKDQIIERIAKTAAETPAVISCRDIVLHYVGNDIVVNMAVGLSPGLTIKDGYATIAKLKNKILDFDRVIDAVISVDLPEKAGRS